MCMPKNIYAYDKIGICTICRMISIVQLIASIRQEPACPEISVY